MPFMRTFYAKFNWIELEMKNANENETKLANETNIKLWVSIERWWCHTFLWWYKMKWESTLNVKIEFSQKLLYDFFLYYYKCIVPSISMPHLFFLGFCIWNFIFELWYLKCLTLSLNSTWTLNDSNEKQS